MIIHHLRRNLFHKKYIASSVFFSSGPLPNYLHLVKNKTIVEDPLQISTLERLQTLYEDLITYEPRGIMNANVKVTRHSFFGNWFKSADIQEKTIYHPSVMGIYIWGGVGCGKVIYALVC
jgi:predicted ATPase